MKKWLAPLLLATFVSLFIAGCGSQQSKQAAATTFAVQILNDYPLLKDHAMTKAKVKRVVDGDTFELDNKDKVRLIGVNTPETVKPNSPVEAYGKEASDFTKEQLTGKTVYLFKDVGDTDKYGRLLRYVFIEDQPVMFNETLVSEGYANTMTIPPNVLFADKFVKLERSAREKKKGLWKGNEAKK